MFVSMWADEYYVYGTSTLQISYTPPPITIQPIGLQLNVSMLNPITGATVLHVSRVLNVTATSALVNLSSPFPFVVPSSSLTSSITLTPLFSIQSSATVPVIPYTVFQGAGAYVLSGYSPPPSSATPTVLPLPSVHPKMGVDVL